jgi:hypothetical protein
VFIGFFHCRLDVHEVVRGNQLDSIFCGQHTLLDNRGSTPYCEDETQELIAGEEYGEAANNRWQVANNPN